MKVFISWSGRKSEAVASALRDWLPGVINALDPFVSAEDVHAGTRWQSEIASELDVSNFGIVCVTRENQAAPWLNFEAGALAKAVELSRLIPLAVDLKTSDVELPLGQFQAQPATEEGMKRVVVSLNDSLAEQRLTGELLRKSFDRWWPDLEAQLSAIEEETSAAAAPARSERELLEETLNTLRGVARAVDQLALRPPLSGDRTADETRRAAIRLALEFLPDRERVILFHRFGFDGEDPKTLQETGKLMGLSRERVRQIEAQALARLAALRPDALTTPDPDPE